MLNNRRKRALAKVLSAAWTVTLIIMCITAVVVTGFVFLVMALPD